MPGYAGNLDVFQPALPMRGVTAPPGLHREVQLISTRTPHAGSDGVVQDVDGFEVISTRTPHAGSDVVHAGQHDPLAGISTRTPHAGSDTILGFTSGCEPISTRTPHAGSDASDDENQPVACKNFNPHSPCGE